MAELISIPSFLTEDLPDQSSLYSTVVTASDSDEITCTRESCGSDSSCTYYGGCSAYCYDCSDCDDEVVLPDPPGKGTITVTKTTKDSITVRITSISGADGYIISCVEKDGEGSYSKSASSSGTYTFEGLEMETTYVLSYYGYNDGGDGSSASVEATTKGLGGCVTIFHQGSYVSAWPYIHDGHQWVRCNAHVYKNQWNITLQGE